MFLICLKLAWTKSPSRYLTTGPMNRTIAKMTKMTEKMVPNNKPDLPVRVERTASLSRQLCRVFETNMFDYLN